MTMITEFADQLYTFMALKYDIICPEFPRGDDIPIEFYDWSASDEFTVEIGHAVLMLSYSYRTQFRRHFQILKPVLTSCKRKAANYPMVFAKVTYTEHAPLKILVLCAFISEMFLFLLFSKKSTLIIQDYIKPATDCFNCVYRAVLSNIDDPIPKWKDVKRVASLLASGYHLLQPVMETEHPSESKDFMESIQLLRENADAAERHAKRQAVLKADEVYDQVTNKKQTLPRRKMEKVNEKLYNTLKAQSHRLFPQAQAIETVKLKPREKSSSLTASCSGTSLNSDSYVEEEYLKTEDENVEKTTSNEPVSEGNVGTSRKYRSKRQSRSKAKLVAMKAKAVAIKDSETDRSTPANPNAEELMVRLSGGLGSEKLESLIAKDYKTESEEDEGKETLV